MRTRASPPAASHAPMDVLRQLEDDIIFGRLAPGARLVEDAMMERYATSRHYVRRALAALERDGLVRHVANIGATVCSFTAEEVRQIYEAREMLTRQIVLMIPLPAPEALIARLEAIQAEYRREAAAPNLRRLHEINDAFHLAMLEGCGNPYLVRTAKDYMRLSLPVRATNLADGEGLQRSLREHDHMIALLRGSDAWALAQLNIEHMQASKSDYLARAAQASTLERTGTRS
ncbi:GntR family transcriptional regulator [Ancylobacter sp. A5.8]|uniref:GntR family transcriptional regulator n=1 Tax=Ancylobacter gelatini TaxID=2919920 RepID=UPI001F4E9FDC|nr:GntR family transcriptional regulator [Ancylobacter gelatini]MCJ8141397.1 GntR family transcriptional regulator [Ancylobacter gelatini]